MAIRYSPEACLTAGAGAAAAFFTAGFFFAVFTGAFAAARIAATKSSDA